jgi:hypothetical protein
MTKDLIIKNIGLLKVIQQLITVLKQKQGFLKNYFTLYLILMLAQSIEELEKQFKEISAACKTSCVIRFVG